VRCLMTPRTTVPVADIDVRNGNIVTRGH
jgi:hypothetical protein